MAEGGLEGGAAVDMQAAHSLGHTADGADSPTSCCCPGDAGAVAVIPSGAHPAARASEVSGWSKSTVPLTQRPGIRHHRLYPTGQGQLGHFRDASGGKRGSLETGVGWRGAGGPAD